MPAETCPALPPTLAAHLAATLRRLRRRYHKRRERCQRKFSETAVHDLRIETRRLLAMLDLLRALHFEAAARKPRKRLKRRLDAFDELRDTHVCLSLLKQFRRELPEARLFDALWRRRERKLIKRLRRKIRATQQTRLQKRLKALEKTVQAAAAASAPRKSRTLVLSALQAAYQQVQALRQRIRPTNTRSIHRTRVAFKRFRYLCESLSGWLPGLTRARLEQMRAYQARMGEIQDLEVMLAAVATGRAQKQVAARDARRLRALLRRRRQEAIERFMAMADELDGFDPRALTRRVRVSQAASVGPV